MRAGIIISLQGKRIKEKRYLFMLVSKPESCSPSDRKKKTKNPPPPLRMINSILLFYKNTLKLPSDMFPE